MSNLTKRFFRWLNFGLDCDGNIALIFAFTLPVLIGLAGLGMDSAAVYNQQSRMQSVADATALAVGKELYLSLDNLSPLRTSGIARAEALLVEVGLKDHPHKVDINFDAKAASTLVQITMQTKTFMPAEIWGQNPIVVRAEAGVYGNARLCVLSLKLQKQRALALGKGARVTAPDCAIQSNSKDPKGLSAKTAALLLSSYTCSSGGYEGSAAAFVPRPETDCPVLDDPLAMREPPQVGDCDFTDVKISTGTGTIQPGHYCGGLKIEKDAEVTAAPGIYVLSGGKLEVKDEASLRGEDVGFYFDDKAATFDLKGKSVVELSGSTDGPLAGILFFENRSAIESRKFNISSDHVTKLIGTIYLPRGTFKASSTDPDTLIAPPPGAPLEVIGAASTYTIIVANAIELDGVNLVINSDYASSDVPVPAGLGPNSTTVQLLK